MDRLKGKVAVVTGAASGIGAETASVLAAEGAAVVVADIDGAAAERHAQVIRGAGGSATAVAADIGVEAHVARMVAAASSEFGGLDILHNNAAAIHLNARDVFLEHADPAVWDEMLHTTVTGTVMAIKAAIPVLLARGGGAIVNTGSVAAHVGELGGAAYSAAKAAILAVTRSTATMYGKRGIRCNTVSPGFIQTPALLAHLDKAGRANQLRHFASTRMGLPADIARTVLFLASDDGAYVNGQAIRVDGGLSMHAPQFAEQWEHLG